LTVILDYGLGNLRSVELAVRRLGKESRIQADLSGATRVILPGVGAFAKAMETLQPVAEDLRKWARSGSPLLGICLGQQLLFDSSEEFGETPGLGILRGRVKYIPLDVGVKVPHIGWSPLEVRQHHGLLAGIYPGDQVYFVHSLVTEPADQSAVAAYAEHGIRFAAAIQHENIWATQFHPEKSGYVGLRILENFLSCS